MTKAERLELTAIKRMVDVLHDELMDRNIHFTPVTAPLVVKSGRLRVRIRKMLKRP